MFITAGDQVPLILLFDWDGNTPGVEPKQYGPNWSNVGVTLFEITTVIVVVVAHCPAPGVNVYTVEPTRDVFIAEGDQVPVIGGVLFELVGNGSGVALRQYGPSGEKTGMVGCVTTMVIVVGVPH